MANQGDGNQLKHDILASTYVSQARVRANQHELDKQGAKLDASAQQADQLQGQTRQAAISARQLVEAARARNRCRRLCHCLCCLGCFRPADDEPPAGPSGPLLAASQPGSADAARTSTASSPRAESLSGHEGELVLRQVDNLLEYKRTKSGSSRQVGWRRRLAPAPGAARPSSSGRATLWFQQVDAGLGELQQAAKEMGRALDEQIRLAQMLSVYLAHGIEDVGTAREELASGRLLA